jgi:serine/threonine protein kinase
MSGNRADWEHVGPLGGGGQSTVSLVRVPKRFAERRGSIQTIQEFNPWGTVMADTRSALTGRFAEAVMHYARPEDPSELGAMKLFKIKESGDEEQAHSRLKQEIAVLREGRTGLPKLLDFNEAEGWIVTEYFAQGTLEHHHSKYRGNAALGLKAFRSLVQTVSSLHKDRYVHRDIKPANVFVRSDDELVLGDFGIVYVPNAPERVTETLERVGPRDYMPQWANLGARLDNVKSKFDVYMLGKLLWCMVDGRAVLPREYHRHPEHDFDLTKTFPGDPNMHLINSILDACVVERERDCLSGAQDLLLAVETTLRIIERGGQLLKEGVPRPCRVCGIGLYQPGALSNTLPALSKGGPVGLRFWYGASETTTVPVYPFVCNTCGHVELFTRGVAKD